MCQFIKIQAASAASASFCLVIAGMGIVGAAAILRDSQGLQVPLWIAMFACVSVVLCGVALYLKPYSNQKYYQWSVVMLLVCMTAVPFGLAFGTERLQCSTNVPIFNGASSCRTVFGTSGIIMLMLALVAAQQAMGKQQRP